jgi:glucose dehydrogenase
MVKINYKYANKNLLEINSNNISNVFLKKMHIFVEKKYENFLINYIATHKNYWLPESNYRKSLPQTKIVKSKTEFTINKNLYIKNKEDWPRSHGNNNSNRFSHLDLINKNNLAKLEIAWIYNSNDRQQGHLDYDIQCNPIVVNGKIFTPTVGGYVVSIDGYTGNEIWRSKKFKDGVARRGIVYWEGDKLHEPRIYFSDFNRLLALNANNGQLVKSFGNKKGYAKTGASTIAPIIYKNNLVIASSDKNVEIYDLIDGKLKSKIFVEPSNDPRSYRQNSDKIINKGFKPKKKIDHAIKEIEENFIKDKIKFNKKFFRINTLKIINKN